MANLCPSKTGVGSVNFWSFTVAWTGGGGSLIYAGRPSTGRSQGTTNRQPPTPTNHQLPPPAANHQRQPTANRQPPPTATNHQLPTANRQSPPPANRQPPPTMVEHMECPRTFFGKIV